MTCIPIHTLTRADWLRERQKGIGASDAPNLLGVGYGDPEQVYRSKVGPARDDRPSGVMLRGIELEPIIAAKYAAAMDVDIDQVPMYQSIAFPWMLATPDRCRVDLPRFVQLKTCGGFEDWGPSGSDQIPLGYRVQVTQEMGVTGTDSIDVAALDVFGWELRIFRVGLDRTLLDRIIAAGSEFWNLIAKSQPVPGDWLARHGLDPAAGLSAGKGVTLPVEVAELIERRERIASIGKEAESKERELTALIAKAMGDAEQATAGDWRLKRSLIRGGPVSYDRKDYFKMTISKAKGKA